VMQEQKAIWLGIQTVHSMIKDYRKKL